jgi:hypothetical protein
MSAEACRSVERRATRMLQMMRRLHVDPSALIRLRRGEAYTDTRAHCFACVTTGECMRWLDGYALEDAHPGFCPNLQLFRLLQDSIAHLHDLMVQHDTNGCVSPIPATHYPGGAPASPN